MKSHRKERVARVIRDIVSHAIAHELSDPRVDPLTTVTRVAMVGDLEVARVYLTVAGDEAAERRTLQAIRHARGFLQRIVASEMVIRQCPILEFDIDMVSRKTRETMDLLAENRRRQPELFEPESGNLSEDHLEDDDGDETDAEVMSDDRSIMTEATLPHEPDTASGGGP